MIYKVAVTVPKGTSKSDPLRETTRLTAGVIDRVEIEFPAGCAGLVGARVLHNEFQLWPLTSGEWFVTDDFTISFPEHREFDDDPLWLTLVAYNEDTAYDHTLSFRFSVSPPHEDPLKQIAEIIAAREERAAGVAPEQVTDLQEGMRIIYNVLYSIDQKLTALVGLQRGRGG